MPPQECVRCGHGLEAGADFCSACHAVVPPFLNDEDDEPESTCAERPAVDVLPALAVLDAYLKDGRLTAGGYAERLSTLDRAVHATISDYLREEPAFMDGLRNRYVAASPRAMSSREEDAFRELGRERKRQLEEMRTLFSEAFENLLAPAHDGAPPLRAEALELAQEAQKLLGFLHQLTAEFWIRLADHDRVEKAFFSRAGPAEVAEDPPA